MKESDLNRRAMEHVLSTCSRAVYYKIADKFTAGIPDSVLNWNHVVSWLEFKLLDPNESIHDQLKAQQLVELVKLENAGMNAWVVAFRRANVKKLVLPQTVFYRPTALLRGAVPVISEPMRERMGPATYTNVLRDLRTFGVAQFPGHDYQALSSLIHQTHEGY